MRHLPRLLGLLLVTACPKDATTTVPPTPEDVTARMNDHFETVSDIKDAVIAGELATARELGEVLRDREREGDPTSWQPHLARLTEASAAAAMAHDLGPAAAATASLGATCGACHEATGADPMFDPDPPPMQDEGAAAAMRRHQWGVDRMWEGLIMPSQESWRWGAETIDETPGCTDVDPEDAYRIELCQKVEALGRSALDARTRDDRTRIYGEFLATCSSCHQASAGEVTRNSENFRNSSAPDERAGVARRSKYARYAFGHARWHARR